MHGIKDFFIFERRQRMPPIIKLDNITKTFLVDGSPFNALDGVSL